jgi:hypothetical protein
VMHLREHRAASERVRFLIIRHTSFQEPALTAASVVPSSKVRSSLYFYYWS